MRLAVLPCLILSVVLLGCKEPPQDKPDDVPDEVKKEDRPPVKDDKPKVKDDTPPVKDKEKPCPKTAPGKTAELPKSKWVIAEVEKEFGLKLKSVELSSGESSESVLTTRHYRVVLEFDKDVEAEKLMPLRRALVEYKNPSHSGPRLSFKFHDSDNVVKKSVYEVYTEGEVTGRKGDAFRLMLYPPPEWTAKVELRYEKGMETKKR